MGDVDPTSAKRTEAYRSNALVDSVVKPRPLRALRTENQTSGTQSSIPVISGQGLVNRARMYRERITSTRYSQFWGMCGSELSELIYWSGRRDSNPRPSAPKFDSVRNFNNLTGTVGAVSPAK